MRNFQGIVFIWTQTFREIFKSALVYLGLCYLQNESVSMKVFLLHESRDFIWSGNINAYTSFNLLHILIFFLENYWPCITSSSKCWGRVSHGGFGFLGMLTQVDIVCYCNLIYIIKPDVQWILRK